jgi:hypothetical protein
MTGQRQVTANSYHWHQAGELGSADSGCAIGVRRDYGALVKPRIILGSPAGEGIRDRSILTGRVTPRAVTLSFTAAAGHAPPARAPRGRARFLARMALVRAKFKGGDFNVPGTVAQRLLNRRVVGAGVLWLTIPRYGWRVEWSRAIDVTGDHKAVLARVRHRHGHALTLLIINCMSVSTGPGHAATILRHGLELHPDVVLAVECTDFRAAEVVHRPTTLEENR